MKVIVMDVKDFTVKEFNLTGPEGSFFKDFLYPTIGTNVVERVCIEKNDFWIDEEGNLKSPTRFVRCFGQLFAGTVVIAGHKGSVSCDTSMTLEDVKRKTTFMVQP